MKCRRKHTRYQVEDEDWMCPKCDSYLLDHGECTLLHTDEYVLCDACGYSLPATTFSNKVRREKNLTTCPHCKGKGVVAPTQTNPTDKLKETVLASCRSLMSQIIRPSTPNEWYAILEAYHLLQHLKLNEPVDDDRLEKARNHWSIARGSQKLRGT